MFQIRCKVWTLWQEHKIWKKPSTFYSIASNLEDFFIEDCVPLSEGPNFTPLLFLKNVWHLRSRYCFRLLRGISNLKDCLDFYENLNFLLSCPNMTILLTERAIVDSCLSNKHVGLNKMVGLADFFSSITWNTVHTVSFDWFLSGLGWIFNLELEN